MTIDPFHPLVPAGAYDEFLPGAVEQARTQRDWTPADGRLPALFVSHGAPPLLDDPVWLRELRDWGHSMPRPTGIVVISAHWENAPLAISATDPRVPLYYDFGGFHRRYYTLQYRTPDATALARRVVPALAPAGPVHQYVDRGLDHGAFIPLMAMYPLADIPVLQVSMPSLDPADLFALGRRLHALRDEGMLIIGSGFATHFLGVFRLDPSQLASMTDFNAEFDAWLADTVTRGDVDALIDYRTTAPGNARAHPTADHYVPLLTALGAADDVQGAVTSIEGTVFANSKRSFQLA